VFDGPSGQTIAQNQGPRRMNANEFWVQYQKEPVPGVSKYALLRDVLVDAIASGHWKRGELLPTEQDLARETPFSLGTVQRALRSLVDDGIIVRRQGFGTFVADNVKPLNRPWHMRFIPPEGGAVVETYTYVLGRESVKKKGRWSPYFPNKSDLFTIERRFRIADKFWVFNRFYSSASILGALQRCALGKLSGVNLKEMIIRQYGLPITGIEHRLKIAHFDAELCRHLEITKGATGLLLEGVARTGPDAVYYQEFYVPESGYYLDLPSAYTS
jgi:GntR family transcriptional regulator